MTRNQVPASDLLLETLLQRRNSVFYLTAQVDSYIRAVWAGNSCFRQTEFGNLTTYQKEEPSFKNYAKKKILPTDAKIPGR
jgi:hypothetical protein